MASEIHSFPPTKRGFLFRGFFSRDDQHLQAVQPSPSKTSNHVHSIVDIHNGDNRTSQKQPSSFQNVITKWSAILTMSSCFLLGLILAISHHCYYQWLDGQVIGNSNRQQWALRFGSTFGALVGAFLKIAVGCAYIQYVWLRLSQKNISLGAIDATFDVLGNPWRFLTFEMVRFLNFAVVMIFISWCIPLSQIFPAATLSVRVHIGSEIRPLQAMRPSLMYHGKELTEDGRWTTSLYYSGLFDDKPWGKLLTSKHPEISEQISSDLRLLATTVAVGGRVIPPHISIPYSNYTYNMTVYLPRLQCQPSDPTNFPLNQSSISPWLIEIDHWDLPKDTEFTFNMSNFQYSIISSNLSQSNFTGQIWYLALAESLGLGLDMRPLPDGAYDQRIAWNQVYIEPYTTRRTGRLDIAQYDYESQTLSTFECRIYNSSFEVDVAVNQGSSKISTRNIVDIGPVQIAGREDATYNPKTALLDYWFRRLTDSILGYMTNSTKSNNLFNTVITPTWVDHIPKIEELSINTSLSLMSNDGYCMPVMVDANFTTIQNVYDYRPQNLLISYGIVFVFTLVALILGVFSFHRNGTSYDILVSTIGTCMQNPEMAKVLGDIPLGMTGIKPESMEVRMRLATYVTSDEGGNTSENTQKRGFVPMIP